MNFANERHALYAGWVLGTLIRRGQFVLSMHDENNDYLPLVRFVEDDPAASFVLAIPEPPDEWHL
jgi:hypothetical protein